MFFLLFLFQYLLEHKLFILVPSLLLFTQAKWTLAAPNWSQPTANNQWLVEESFCHQLEVEHNITLCYCLVSESNRLSLMCDGSRANVGARRTKYVTELDKTFQLVASFEQLSLEDITLNAIPGLLQLDLGPLNKTAVNELHIYDCVQLRHIKSDNMEKGKLCSTMHLVEIVNTNLMPDLFHFIRKLSAIHTVLLSDVYRGAHFGRQLEFILDQGNCLPIRRLAMNHRCLSTEHDHHQANQTEKSVPLLLPKRAFADLCHVQVLDLSCLGLEHFDGIVIRSPAVNETTNKELILDLSYNQLVDVDDLAQNIDTGISGQYVSIGIELSHNPIGKLPPTLSTANNRVKMNIDPKAIHST